jgi:hypothetical protein
VDDRCTEPRGLQPLEGLIVVGEDGNGDLRMIVERLKHPREPEMHQVGGDDRGLDRIPEPHVAAGLGHREHAGEVDVQPFDRAEVGDSVGDHGRRGFDLRDGVGDARQI